MRSSRGGATATLPLVLGVRGQVMRPAANRRDGGTDRGGFSNAEAPLDGKREVPERNLDERDASSA